MEDIIKKYEERLRLAMMSHDIEELDKLLSDNLVFINHFGQFVSKDDDISSHKQGIFKLSNINIINQDIRIIGDVIVVISDAKLDVVINHDISTDHLIYTRIWEKINNEWKVVGGQATRVV